MKMTKKRGVALVLIVIFLVVLGWLVWLSRNDLWMIGNPYISAARYHRLEERYNGFVGMEAEEVVPLLTKYERYLILDGHTAEWGADTGAFFFPVGNSGSPEECFIYGLELDEDHVILGPIENGWDTGIFFTYLKERRGD